MRRGVEERAIVMSERRVVRYRTRPSLARTNGRGASAGPSISEIVATPTGRDAVAAAVRAYAMEKWREVNGDAEISLVAVCREVATTPDRPIDDLARAFLGRALAQDEEAALATALEAIAGALRARKRT